MADFAKQLISGAQKSIEGQGNQVEEIVGIAQQFEAHEMNKQKFAQQTQALEEAKIGKLSNTILSGLNIKDPKSRNLFLKKFVPKQRDALGLTEAFPDDALGFVFSSPENQLKYKGIVSKVQRGEMDVSAAMGLLNDPTAYANFTLGAGEAQELLEAEKGALGRQFQQEKFARTEARQVRESGIREERSVRKEAAKLNREDENDILKKSTFITKNGISNTLNTLKALDKLIPGGFDNFKGDLAGIGATGNFADFLVSAPGKQLRQVAGELKNSILKMRSGGAVTKEEAARLIGELGMSEGFVPQFKSDKQFITGLKRVRSKLQDVMATSEAGFNTTVNSEFNTRFKANTGGVLSSRDPFFSGKKAKQLPSLEVFNSATPAQQEAAAKRLGMSREELLKQIGAE